VNELDAGQRAKLADYWWQRAEGEMTSWIGFQHVVADLRAERSPSAVIELAERAVEDEHQHALWCRDWARRFGHSGDEVRPRTERPVTLHGGSEHENRLLRIALCCFTETVGCFILRQVRPLLSGAELRGLNRRHLADELRHSRVGWGHLSVLDRRQKDTLRSFIPELFRLLPIACCEGREQDLEELVPYGYFTPRLLQAAHDAAVSEVIGPGLEHLGMKAA
jgi:hypothetical protein